MGVIRQVIIEIIRKPTRSILFGMSVFVFVIFAGLGLFIQGAVDRLYQIFVEKEGYRLAIEIPDNFCMEDWAKVEEILQSIPYIDGYNNTNSKLILCDAVDFTDYGYSDLPSEEDNSVYLCGNLNIDFAEYFRNETLNITSGYFPIKGESGVLIDEDLASQNNLQLGNQITVSYMSQEMELPVTGIYQVNEIPQAESAKEGYFADSKHSIIFSDYASYEMLSGDMDFKLLSVFVDEYEHMNDVYQALSVALGEQALIIDTIQNHADSTGSAINALTKVSSVFLFVSMLLFLGCEILLTILWAREHAAGIAIYKVLGQKNIVTIIKMLSENVLISLLASGMAFFVNYIVTVKCGKQILLNLINVSGNNIKYWDVSNIDYMFTIDKSDLLIPIIVSIAMTAIISFIFSMIMVNLKFRKIKAMC